MPHQWNNHPVSGVNIDERVTIRHIIALLVSAVILTMSLEYGLVPVANGTDLAHRKHTPSCLENVVSLLPHKGRVPPDAVTILENRAAEHRMIQLQIWILRIFLIRLRRPLPHQALAVGITHRHEALMESNVNDVLIRTRQ